MSLVLRAFSENTKITWDNLEPIWAPVPRPVVRTVRGKRWPNRLIYDGGMRQTAFRTSSASAGPPSAPVMERTPDISSMEARRMSAASLNRARLVWTQASDMGTRGRRPLFPAEVSAAGVAAAAAAAAGVARSRPILTLCCPKLSKTVCHSFHAVARRSTSC